MTTEIERRFLIAEPPPGLGEGTAVRQGYVALEGDVSVRVRDAGGRRSLTLKAGTGRERVEVERELSAAEFDALWPLTGRRRITKTRHVVPVDEHRAEVDVFGEGLDGLVIVEVEFASPAEADAFGPPAWFGQEVTGVAEWGNASLAVHGRPP